MVVPAPKKEFELTITKTGQLREFLNIAYSMGIKKLIVVVNKMDATSPPYSQVRSQQRTWIYEIVFYVLVFVCVLFKLRKLTNHKHYIKINLRQTVYTLFARVSNRSKLLATRFNCQDLLAFPLKPSTEHCKNPLKWTILSQEQYSNENHCQFLWHKANFRLPHLQIMDCLYLSRHLTSFELVFQISIIV